MKKISIYLVVLGLLVGFTPVASADVMRNARGSVVVNKGTVYFVGADTLYPFPSMEVFRSYGHVLSDIKPANAADMALKIGPVATLNNRPFGHVDEINETGYVHGWVVDRDNLNTEDGFSVLATFDEPYRADGNYKYPMLTAQTAGYLRSDVNAALGISGNYGFALSVIDELMDGLPHTMYVYAVDKESMDKPVQLVGSPKQFIVSSDYSMTTHPMFFLGSPSGGEYWALDSWETIWWGDETSKAYNDTYRLYLVNTNSSEYHLIASGVGGTSYDWIVGSVLDQEDLVSIGFNYKIQVINEVDGSYIESNDEFTIYEESEFSSSLSQDEQTELMNVYSIVYILSGLDDYYTTNGVFPSSLNSALISEVDLSPVAVGSCSENDAQIIYTPTNNSTNFTLKFCLGTDYLYNEFGSVPELVPYQSLFVKGVKVWDWQDYLQLKDL